tara:strand:- start:73 stop:1380 length:1308 start_codon:yes stop_codon:yes gene_type:complete
MYITSQASKSISDALKKLKAEGMNEYFSRRDQSINYYQYHNTEQYIKQYFGGSLQDEIPLYTTSLTKRLIKRISLVYKNAPTRLADARYFDYVGHKDYEMKAFEKLHNLVGTIAIKVSMHNGKIKRTPILEYEPIFSDDNMIDPVAVLYPVPHPTDSKMQTRNDHYIYWSADEHYMVTNKGEKIKINENDVNPYGCLPFVFVQPDTIIDEHFNVGAIDIAECNKQIDIAMTMLQHHIRSAGGQFVINGRVDDNKIELGLNKVVVLEDGTMSNITSNTNINNIIEGIKFQLQNVAINHHISFDFGINGNASGIAIKVSNLELLESREDAVECFRMVEKDMFDIEKKMIESEYGILLDDEFNIDFNEIDFPDPAQEMAQWEFKFKHGLADPADYLMEINPDGFETREDALEHIKERKGQASANGANLLKALQTNNEQ